jgi:hypothetical protein
MAVMLPSRGFVIQCAASLCTAPQYVEKQILFADVVAQQRGLQLFGHCVLPLGNRMKRRSAV